MWGRYELVRDIGSGGMGTLYEALDKRVSKTVAIKFLSPMLLSDETIMKRFEREAHALGRIRHDHVCDVSDYGITDEGVPFIVMELLEGESLGDVIARDRRLPIRRAIHIMIEVLSALSAVHGIGIVHRDLKPDNIFLVLTALGETRAKIIDFGIAKYLDATSPMTTEGTAIGTPYYMSPEQVGGQSQKIDHRTDVWAVGVILYESIVGAVPFSGDNPQELFVNILINDPPSMREAAPSLPPAVERAIMRALEKEVDDRYEDAADFAAVLMDLEATRLSDADWATDTTPSKPPSFAVRALEQEASLQSAPIEDASENSGDVDPFSETGHSEPKIDLEGGDASRERVPLHQLSTMRDGFDESDRASSGRELPASGDESPLRQWRTPLLTILAMALIGGGGGAVWYLVSTQSPSTDTQVAEPDLVPLADVTPAEPVPHESAAPDEDVESPPAKTVDVWINTTPREAELFLDGEQIENPFVGHLPFATEPRTLEARYDGYRSVIQHLSLEEEQHVRIELKRGRGVDDRRHSKADSSGVVSSVRRPAKRTEEASSKAPSEESPPRSDNETSGRPTEPAPEPAEPAEVSDREARRNELKRVGLP